MAINTNRIAARLAKSWDALEKIEAEEENADKALKAADLLLNATLNNPPTLTVTDKTTAEQMQAHTEAVTKYNALCARLGAESEAANNAWNRLNSPEGMADLAHRLRAMRIIIAQQTAAVERKAAVYPALLKSHLRRQANAGDKTAKPAA